jgi:hypothetical protein
MEVSVSLNYYLGNCENWHQPVLAVDQSSVGISYAKTKNRMLPIASGFVPHPSYPYIVATGRVFEFGYLSFRFHRIW